METTSHVAEALREIRDERAQIREKLRALQRRESALVRAEAGLLLLVPSDQPKPNLPPPPEPEKVSTNGNGYPKTTDAVFAILKNREGKQVSVRRLVRDAQEEGLLDPSLKRPYGTILEAAKRLENRDPRIRKFNKDGQLWFFYKSPGANGASGKEEGGES